MQLVLYYLSDSLKIQGSSHTIYFQRLSVGTNGTNFIVEEPIFSMNIFITNAIYLLFASCFHLYYAYYKLKYNEYISPKLRWVEYGLITPIMFIQIGVFAGIRDIFTLLSIGALVSNSMIFGYIQDRLSGYKINWSTSPHSWAYMSYLVIWGIVVTQLILVYADSNSQSSTSIILTIYISFFFETLFGIIQFFFVVIPYNKGYERIDDTSIMEMDGCVHLVSLLSKMTQVWIPIISLIF